MAPTHSKKFINLIITLEPNLVKSAFTQKKTKKT